MKNFPIVVVILFTFACNIIAQNNHTEIDKFLNNSVAKKELSISDISEYRITDRYVNPKTKIEHIYFIQTLNGIDIHKAVGSIHLSSTEKVVSKYHHFLKDLNQNKSVTFTPDISASEAIMAVSQQMGYNPSLPLKIMEEQSGKNQKMLYDKNGISKNEIPINLAYYQDEDHNYQLSWELYISEIEGFDYWHFFVDAKNGEILKKYNMTYECFDLGEGHSHENEKSNSTTSNNKNDRADNESNHPGSSILIPNSYNVFSFPTESPNFGGRSIVSNVSNATASPYGWHDTDGMPGAENTITFGNNVHSFSVRDINNFVPGTEPNGGINLEFDFPLDLSLEPVDYQMASNTNTFYANNVLHDVLYQYGFNEVSGNFQLNNYGNGGLGGDHVLAFGQFGAENGSNCNAVFNAPPDGQNGLTATFVCDRSVPKTDAAFDNGVLAHEYGHGLSIRISGGPANSSCLISKEQMGEGYSDFLSLIMTMEPGDQPSDPTTVGTYLLGQDASGPGTRTPPFNAGKPYSPDFSVNDQTYGSLQTESFSVPHGVGSLWAEMLWEMTWTLIDEYGWDPDIYNGNGGNNRALALVVESFRYLACEPGFVDGRDAILMADTMLNKAENACLIWEAFAKRGLGYSASQGSSNSILDGIEAFDLPPGCGFSIDDDYQSICGDGSVKYSLVVGELEHGNTNPITLNTMGLPPDITSSFSTNPVAPGGSSELSLNIGGAAPGKYNFVLKATSGNIEETVNAFVNVGTQVPANPILISPRSSLLLISKPLLTWRQDLNVDSFMVEVATDPSFQNIFDAATIRDTNFIVQNIIPDDTYYWRVKGINACGSGSFSTANNFRAKMGLCNTYASTDVPLIITSGRGEYLSTFEYTSPGIITDLNVDDILLNHAFSPRVDIKLISPQGTEIILYEASCLDDESVIINFDDEAIASFPCPANDGGTYFPLEPLSAFDGENAEGVWTLKLTDRSGGEGELVSWGLTICASEPIIVPTLGQWAILILFQLLSILGIVFIRAVEISKAIS